MSDPIVFASATPRLALPLLFAGQSQKEVFVNEAHALVDALLHAAVEGEADDPPASPAEGESWLVGATPSGAWADRAGRLASFQTGAWLFVEPREGMRVHDLSTGQSLLFRGGWQRPATPSAPAGGSTVDNEARAAIAELVDILVASGILPQP
jgi:hypothetical protein